MSSPRSHLDQPTGYQGQYPKGSPNPTPGLNQAYYDSETLSPPFYPQSPNLPPQPQSPYLLSPLQASHLLPQPQSPYLSPTQYQPFQPVAPAQQYPAHTALGYSAPPPAQQAHDFEYYICPQSPPSSQQIPQEYQEQYSQQFTYAPNPYAALPLTQSWQPQQPLSEYIYPRTPDQPLYMVYARVMLPSLGYDERQTTFLRSIDTFDDIITLHEAVGGVRCNNTALVCVFADRKYQFPWDLDRLKTHYESQFGSKLIDQVKSKTRGIFRDALEAFFRGPLNHDVYTLEKALSPENADQLALNEVLLCRSNADIRTIINRYNSAPGRDLLQDIRAKVDGKLFYLYDMVLSGMRAEDTAPIVCAETHHKVAEIQRLLESPAGIDTTSLIDILARANAAQLRSIADIYQQHYKQLLEEVIEQKVRDSTRDALLWMLTSALTKRGKADAHGLARRLVDRENDSTFIYRALQLYWGGGKRLEEAHFEYKEYYKRRLKDQLRVSLTGDYKDLMVALIGESPIKSHKYAY